MEWGLTVEGGIEVGRTEEGGTEDGGTEDGGTMGRPVRADSDLCFVTGDSALAGSADVVAPFAPSAPSVPSGDMFER